MRKIGYVLPLFLSVVLLLGACGAVSDKTDGTQNAAKTVDITLPDGVVEGVYETSEQTSTILLNGSKIETDASSVKIKGSVATVTEAGTYIVKGILDNGYIAVDAEKEDEVTLVLNGAEISCNTFAAVYVKQAKKVTVYVADGSENYLANGGGYELIDDNNTDAAVFSKDDIIFDGGGKLTVKASAGHGIVSKDDLEINGGILNIGAASHGICGKDSVTVTGGNITVSSGKDGIRAENVDDTTKGAVLITGGTVTISSDGDGLSASSSLTVENGTFDITSGGGSEAETVADTSSKGIKASGDLVIGGGTFTINSSDDAIHSNATVTINNGSFSISTSDDGVHADNATVINGGELTVLKSYEGVEGLTVEINGGTLDLTASDDGINAAGGNDNSGFGEPRGGDVFGSASSSSYIKITGGTVYVNADGDGVDSNGSLEVSGGSLFVSGPASSGNGALDFDGNGIISAGTVIAVGSSGMAQNFGTSSTQGSALISVGNRNASDKVTLTDENGTVLAEYEPEKAYSTVVISCPAMKQGGTYTVSAGDFSETFTLTSLIYGGGNGFNGGGAPNGGDRPNGGRPGGGGFGR